MSTYYMESLDRDDLSYLTEPRAYDEAPYVRRRAVTGAPRESSSSCWSSRCGERGLFRAHLVLEKAAPNWHSISATL